MKQSCSPVITEPAAWRLRVDGAQSGLENMAADAQLLEDQKSPDALPALRFFRWRNPTVSYGRLQNPEWVKTLTKSFHVGLTSSAPIQNMEIVQRPTGGGMVWHDQDLSFSLTWKRDHPSFPKCLKDVYRMIHQTVGDALNRRGIETSFHVKQSSAKPAAGICFVEPAEDDLMWKGKKILGGALRVTSWGRLYQGNLLVGPTGLDVSDAVQSIASVFETNFQTKPL